MSIDDKFIGSSGSCWQHRPAHVYEWTDRVARALHPEGLYYATCQRCGTDYRIPAYAEAILEFIGNVKIEWKSEYECHLESGDVFKKIEAKKK